MIMMMNGGSRDGGGGNGSGGVQCQQPPHGRPHAHVHWVLWLISELYIITI